MNRRRYPIINHPHDPELSDNLVVCIAMHGMAWCFPIVGDTPLQVSYPDTAPDPLIPELLALPPGTALHNHPLVTSGQALNCPGLARSIADMITAC